MLIVVSDSLIEEPKDVVYMSDTVTENTLIMQLGATRLRMRLMPESQSLYGDDIWRLHSSANIRTRTLLRGTNLKLTPPIHFSQ